MQAAMDAVRSGSFEAVNAFVRASEGLLGTTGPHVASEALVGAVANGLAWTFVWASVCWALQLATSEYSWVDRSWSTFPAVMAVHAALSATAGSARAQLMAFLVILWGIRLTYNFARRGGYSHLEDYRWSELRRSALLSARWRWELFMWFMCYYQMFLIFSTIVPIYVCAAAGEPLHTTDIVLAALFLGMLLLETVTDQTQWVFQEEKHRKIRLGLKLNPEEAQGFCTTGIFRYSRHANFFAEQSLWVLIFLFVFPALQTVQAHWSALGAVLLISLFQGSTWFTEKLTLRKYPAYAQYQKTTSRLIPLPPSGGSKLD